VHPHFGSGIPVLVWGCLDPHLSPNRFGDSFEAHPHFSLGIPVLVWGFGDPRFGNMRHHLVDDRYWYAFGVVHYQARARRRPFIIYEIIYAARWGVGLPLNRDAKIHMSHD
jgi:hypothetical protein